MNAMLLNTASWRREQEKDRAQCRSLASDVANTLFAATSLTCGFRGQCGIQRSALIVRQEGRRLRSNHAVCVVNKSACQLTHKVKASQVSIAS